MGTSDNMYHNGNVKCAGSLEIDMHTVERLSSSPFYSNEKNYLLLTLAHTLAHTHTHTHTHTYVLLLLLKPLSLTQLSHLINHSMHSLLVYEFLQIRHF